MHPVVAPLVAEVRLGLSYLVGVVGKCIVDAAAVDIKILAEVLHRNARALNVPAGVAYTPRRIPLKRLIFKFGLCKPKHEVVLVALVGVLLNALAHADCKVILVKVVEDVVSVELGGVKIHIAARKIGIACVHELGDYLDIFVDAICCRLNNIGGLDVELCAIGEKCIRVEFGYLHDRLVLTLCALEHLVLALIGIAREVADIGDIHDTLDIVTGVAQVLLKNILHDIRAQVAYMCKVIHRRATGVHLDDVGMVGYKIFLFTGSGVIQLHIESP